MVMRIDSSTCIECSFKLMNYLSLKVSKIKSQNIFLGPLGSLLIGYVGCGMTAFIGALITSTAIRVSAFLTNVEQLIAILGFLSGENLED